MRPNSQCDAVPILPGTSCGIADPEEIQLGQFWHQLLLRYRRGKHSDFSRLWPSPGLPSGSRTVSNRQADVVRVRPTDSVHSFHPCSIPVFTRSPVRGISVALRHSVFCFATRPCGFRFLPQQIRSKAGKERRANLFRFPPKKQTFGTWEPGPLPWLCHV